MILFLFLHESSCWVELRLHTENQLPRSPGDGLILVGVCYCYCHCYGGKVKSTNLSWVWLDWFGLEFDKKQKSVLTKSVNSFIRTSNNHDYDLLMMSIYYIVGSMKTPERYERGETMER